jgi:tRNA nucleotidyltransferase (CCA-adding enzyme)
VRFAALTHDLGKAVTPQGLLPKHYGHEQKSEEILEKLCERLPVPNRFRDLARHVARQHGNVHRALELKPETILRIVMEVDGLRQPDRFEEFLLACEADKRGRKGLENEPYPEADRFRTALRAARGVDAGKVRAESALEGEALGQAIHRARLAAVKAALHDEG